MERQGKTVTAWRPFALKETPPLNGGGAPALHKGRDKRSRGALTLSDGAGAQAESLRDLATWAFSGSADSTAIFCASAAKSRA